MNENTHFALVRKPSSAVDKAAPRTKRILSGMVLDALSLVHGESVETIFRRGEDYYHGENYTEAVKYLRKAAERGHARSQYQLGCCYALGNGVDSDFAESAAWFRKAAEQGHIPARYSLGMMYENGEGVEINLSEAAKCYRIAAESWSHPDSIYLVDEGCELDRAIIDLARCYIQGRGVEKDLAEAYMWLTFYDEECYGGLRYDSAEELQWKSLREQISSTEQEEGENRFEKLKVKLMNESKKHDFK